MKKLNKILVTLLLVFTLVMSVVGCDYITINRNGGGGSSGKKQEGDSVSSEVIVQKVADQDVDKKDIVEIIEDMRLSVVDVYAYANNGGGSAGSGVIYGVDKNNSKYYYVITNHHVIDDMDTFKVDVLFINETTVGEETVTEEVTQTYDATLCGGSPSRDIAVLRIEKKGDESLTTCKIANSDIIKVGTKVYAIGNPLGILGGTVTSGIISATAREMQLEDIGTMCLMQTDAAINSGNSGGGLFTEQGYLCGIVNSGYTGYEGLNFAIPSNDADYAATALIDTYTYDSEDGEVLNYGYVTGDTKLKITLTSAQVYTSEIKQLSTDIIYVYSIDSSSVFYNTNLVSYQQYINRKKSYFHAVVGVKINDGETKDIISSNDFSSIIYTLKAGDKLTLKVKSVLVHNSTNWLESSYYYLSSDTSEITVTAEQYIYNPTL